MGTRPRTKASEEPKSHHRYGSSARPVGLSHAQVWSKVPRQRCRVLRTKEPPTTNPVPQKKSRATRPPGHTNPGLKLSTKKFLRSRVIGNCGSVSGNGVCSRSVAQAGRDFGLPQATSEPFFQAHSH